MRTRTTLAASAVLAVGALLGWLAATGELSSLLQAQQPASGQQPAAQPGSPGATTTIDGRYLPTPPQPFKGQISPNAAQSKPYWPAITVPPKGAPNVLLIMTDDVGFSAPSTFGGVIPTPALDRVAKMGLRYTRFHTTALCSPTRAALLTGHNHHSVATGVVVDQATGYPGLQQRHPARRRLHRRNPAAERLRHLVVRQGSQRPAVGGEPSRPLPQLAHRARQGLRLLLRFHRRRHQPVAAEQPVPQHHADRAVSRQARLEPDHRDGRRGDRARQDAQRGPARSALHDLLCARRHALAAPSHQGMGGQDQRDAPLRRGLEQAARADLRQPEEARRDPAERPAHALAEGPAASGTRSRPKQKKLYIRQAKIYAAYLAYTDHEIGRVIQADRGRRQTRQHADHLRQRRQRRQPRRHAEWPVQRVRGGQRHQPDRGTEHEVLRRLGHRPDLPALRGGLGVGLGHAVSSGPSRWPPISAARATAWPWLGPRASKTRAASATSSTMCIDIVPTILEAAGLPEPVMVNGVAQRPIEGVSMAYTWDNANAHRPPADDAILRDVRLPRDLP